MRFLICNGRRMAKRERLPDISRLSNRNSRRRADVEMFSCEVREHAQFAEQPQQPTW
jgi:hypothetical protein